MADKLSETSWTDFSKKQKVDLDDKALVKALAAFDKTSESTPEPRLKALEDVVEQVKKHVAALTKRKKELGDKTFGEVKDKLYAVLETAERLQKEALKAVQALGDEGEEGGGSDLLTHKMVPLIRELKKGDVRMSALIGSVSKSAAVLIARRPISPARRKLIDGALDATGGVKYAKGECYYEAGTLQFVLEGPIGGLAKRVRAALLEQTGLRLKVGLRGDDGEEAEGQDEGEAEQAVAVPAGAGAATATPQAPRAASPEQLAYVQRLRKVQERLANALKAQHPESTKLRALMGFASEKADDRHDYAAAIKALEMIEQVLATPDNKEIAEARDAFSARLTALMPRVKQAMAAGQPSGQEIKLKASEAGALAKQGRFELAESMLDDLQDLLDRQPPSEATGAAGDAVQPGLVAYRKALVAWDGAKRKARADIQKLREALLASHPRQTAAADALSGALDALNAGLADRIDRAINAAKEEQRRRHQAAALKVARNYRKFLEADPLLEDIDDNPLDVKVDAAKTLLGALDEVISSLEAAVA
jgi:hypothetical protein